VRTAFGWVRRLAAVLANKKGLKAAAVRRRYPMFGVTRRNSLWGKDRIFD